ncbi:LuxR family transcriptional regulator [Pusillimonas sp. TS35]|uniref:helix-turn-helix domain-containing protein n=1 Tax=Paracandidimonas lactea TaxID=2895524 RepID=UPI00136C666C|nr:helix-turn-helix domain-containing protein [Paracandidimonas lactea]MYN14841.1 LuxR family transcriptional regulator [Pusillimonas sp. TS35]
MEKPNKALTTRELSCLQWASVGKTSWETGVILGVTERTVNFHIQNACRKLGVHGRQAAITIVLNAGLVPGISEPYLSRVKIHPPEPVGTRLCQKLPVPRPRRLR